MICIVTLTNNGQRCFILLATCRQKSACDMKPSVLKANGPLEEKQFARFALVTNLPNFSPHRKGMVQATLLTG